MYNFNLAMLFIGAFIVFGSDILFKRGKIKGLKNLLIVKGVGLGITIIAMVMMIKYY